MDFISEYKLLQENSINFSEKTDVILSMIKRFNSQKHLDALLNSIESIPVDLSKDYNAVHNFLDLLMNDAFIQKLDDQDKYKIWSYIIKILLVDEKKLQSYLVLRYWLRGLLKYYGDYVDIVDVKKIFQIDLLKNSSPIAFIRYFRANNYPVEYLEAIKAEFNKKEESDITWYNIYKEDIEYISWDDNLFKSFFEIFLDPSNIDVSTELLTQRFSKLWRDEEKLEYFMITIDKLTPELLSKFEDMILLILDGYFKNRYGLDSKYWHIEELFTSENFHYLLWRIVANNENFLNKIIDDLYSRETYIHWPVIDVLVYSLTLQWVDLLINHNLIKDNQRMFFDIYFGVQRSDRIDKENLIQKFKELRWERIEQNDKNIEKSREEDTIRKNEKDDEIKKTIADIIALIKSWKITFSPQLLHLYQESWQLFTIKQKDILKSHIQTILSNIDIANTAKIRYSKEQKNSFTRPDYMSYETLDKCYKYWKELWIDVLWQYQTKFIHYLPFSFNPKYFDDITILSKEEIDYLLAVYSPDRDLKDDLRIFHPYRFFEIVKKFAKQFRSSKSRREKTIYNLKELLKLDNDRLSVRSKKQIISFLANYLSIDFFLKEIGEYINDFNLDKYHYFNDFLSWKISDKQEAEKYDLRCAVNDALCSSFKNEDAIQWRLKQLYTLQISLERMPSWVTYSATPLKEEIDSFMRDERRFIDALESIKHPEYEKQIVKILKHSFRFDQDKNLVAWYLQRFVFSYYDKIKWTGKIDALLSLKKKISSKKNSRNFLEWYFPRLLSKLWYEKLQVYNIKDSYSKLQNQFREAQDEIKFLKDQIKPLDDKTILFVEWKTDKIYIENAYLSLYWKVCPYHILIAWGCRLMWPIIASYIEEQHTAKVYFLVDRDREWIKVRETKEFDNLMSDINLNKWDVWSVFWNNLFVKKHNQLNFHIILLPVPNEFKTLVFKSHYREWWNVIGQWNILDFTYWDECKHSIEQLLYNEESYISWKYNIDWNDYFKENEIAWWVSLIMYNWSSNSQKRRFLAEIIANNDIFPNRTNFKPIFDYIDSTA